MRKHSAVMDEQSLRVLEYGQVLDIIAGYTHWQPSREIILALQPFADMDLLQRRQREVMEAIRIYDESSGIGADGLDDCRESIVGAERGRVISPQELWHIGMMASASRRAGKYLRDHAEEFPCLADRALRLGSFVPLEQLIMRSLTAEGQVRDSASSRLRQLRQDVNSYRDRLRGALNAVLHNRDIAKMVQESLITVRANRYVVPVKAEYRSAFPGLVIDQSSSGATVFMEPWSVVDLGNKWRAAVLDEASEVEAILTRISAAVGLKSVELLASVEELAWIDALLALAVYSHRCEGIVPEIVAGGNLRLVEARHPLLVQKLERRVVPISIELSREYRTLVITGPNTGGKTVALKTTGLLALMALAGMPVPVSSGSYFPFLREVWADIGDEQSIAQSLSTFSAHIIQILRMLPQAGPETLILIDELGAGTDPVEGSALGKALLEYFHKRGSYTIITTHMSELKAFATSSDGFDNAAVEFDSNTLAPTYRILMGVPGRSNAIRIARNLGLPQELEKRARELVGGHHVEVDTLLDELDSERHQVEALERRLNQEMTQAEKLRREYETRMEDVELERQRILEEGQAKVNAMIEDSRSSIHGMMRGLRKHLASLGHARGESLQATRKAAKELAATVMHSDKLEELQKLSPLAGQSLAEAVAEALKLKAAIDEGKAEPVAEPVPPALKLKTADIKPAPPKTAEKKGKKHPATLEQRLDEVENEAVEDYTPYMETPDPQDKVLDDALEAKARQAVRQVEADIEEIAQYSRKCLPPRPPKPKKSGEPLKVGDNVYVSRMGQNGVIISLKGSQAEVQMGIVRMYLKLKDLERIEAPRSSKKEREYEVNTYTTQIEHRRARTSVDLHGMTVDEALLELGYAIDEAFMNGLSEFTINHGRGTGTLRSAVAKYVREHPLVADFRRGDNSEGGIGVTIIKLK